MSKKSQKDRMIVEIARQIIFKDVSNQIPFKMMDLKNLKEM